MSEAMNKVRGVNELPLFPLPIVLFPGVPLPLHIFEPRYRQMLTDIQSGNQLFGLSFLDTTTSTYEVPPAGHVGCVAELTDTQVLPDGRSNILTVGVVRYRVDDYVERGDPYLVARVSFFEDEEEDAGVLSNSSQEVGELFTRIAKAIRILNDERPGLPDISDTEPEKLSFLVAAAMELEGEVKQSLLEMRSTSTRLERLRDLLSSAVSNYEERARIHELAKGNGHGGKHIDIE